LLLPTSPGTLIKVTPDKEAPIIPKATKNQGDCRSPVKKEFEEMFLLTIQEIRNSNRKYDVITTGIKFESIQRMRINGNKIVYNY